MSFLDSWSPRLLALLRVVAGLMFFEHGCMKILHFPAGMAMSLPPLLMAAGVIELVAGALIVLGLFTKPAAFIASGETAVAYFGYHVTGALGMGAMPGMVRGWNPASNGGAEVALYAVIFLYIASAGAGAYALDSMVGKKRGLEAASA